MPHIILADILVTILDIVQFISLVRMVARMTASTVHGTSTTNILVITVIHI